MLCAGYGKRMKPYTDIYQKTMIPLHGKPLLEYIINGIKYAGIKDIILVVGYRKEQIINYFESGSKWNLSIEYVEQKDLNGTGGALLLCENLIYEQHFFLTWGDIIVPYRIYKKVYEIFKEENEDFILVTNYLDDLRKGCEIQCEGNYCIKMIEKPSKEFQTTNLNNCGIFIFSKEIFKELKLLKPSNRGELEIPEAISNGIHSRKWKVRIVKMNKNDFRGDLGDPKVYKQLKKEKKWLKKIYD
ncbi:MAG: nucleotidyltransferase family protein [Promethearchaeota archaeon]